MAGTMKEIAENNEKLHRLQMINIILKNMSSYVDDVVSRLEDEFDDCEDFEDYVTVYNKNISFIGAPTDPRRANKIDPKYLSIILDKAVFKYDFVIFDMSHILNEVNVNILDMVDKILLMTTNDPLDLKNLKTVLSLFKDSNINKYKVILNDSVANNRDYFSLYDLKVIIDNNIDYIISNKFYVPNMDAYVFDGKIFTLEEKKYPDEDVFNLIIKDAGGKDE